MPAKKAKKKTASKKVAKKATEKVPPSAEPVQPPNIDTKTQAVPAGFVFVEGQHLQLRAKGLGIPFGLATHRINEWSVAIDGIVIHEKDKEKWEGPKPPRDAYR